MVDRGPSKINKQGKNIFFKSVSESSFSPCNTSLEGHAERPIENPLRHTSLCLAKLSAIYFILSFFSAEAPLRAGSLVENRSHPQERLLRPLCVQDTSSDPAVLRQRLLPGLWSPPAGSSPLRLQYPQARPAHRAGATVCSVMVKPATL